MGPHGEEVVDYVCDTESLVCLGFVSTLAVGFLDQSITDLNFGRASQTRTSDLYRAKALVTR